jgi:hypothetical protein
MCSLTEGSGPVSQRRPSSGCNTAGCGVINGVQAHLSLERQFCHILKDFKKYFSFSMLLGFAGGRLRN